jgi:hypothetical protein
MIEKIKKMSLATKAAFLYMIALYIIILAVVPVIALGIAIVPITFFSLKRVVDYFMYDDVE